MAKRTGGQKEASFTDNRERKPSTKNDWFKLPGEV
jgi:hypothetical protein